MPVKGDQQVGVARKLCDLFSQERGTGRPLAAAHFRAARQVREELISAFDEQVLVGRGKPRQVERVALGRGRGDLKILQPGIDRQSQ